jgi:carotenoid cleavage dioxygenase
MNSYEQGDKIILDVARFSHIWRESAMDFPAPELWRWTIDTTNGRVHEEQIDDRSAEFPRVADSVVGLKHRYGYMMSMSQPGTPDDPMSAAGAILKYDRETGERSDIELGQGRVGGEPVFVAADNAKSEDDGYLMTYVYDANTDESQFVIMDAASMDNEPVAAIDLPRVPGGFHGNWIPASVAN